MKKIFDFFKKHGDKFLFFISIMILSNLSYYFSQENVNKESRILIKDHSQKIENFFFLVSYRKNIDSNEINIESTASGAFIGYADDKILVITAAHFCDISIDADFSLQDNIERSFILFNNVTGRIAKPVYIDQKNDICFLESQRLPNDKFIEPKISKSMPAIGEKTYNASAPSGVSSPNVTLIFEGYFSGCDNDICYYTIPATYGSSGSAVYNRKGELIGIIIAVTQDFDNISLGPNIKIINEALMNIYNERNIQK